MAFVFSSKFQRRIQPVQKKLPMKITISVASLVAIVAIVALSHGFKGLKNPRIRHRSIPDRLAEVVTHLAAALDQFSHHWEDGIHRAHLGAFVAEFWDVNWWRWRFFLWKLTYLICWSQFEFSWRWWFDLFWWMEMVLLNVSIILWWELRGDGDLESWRCCAMFGAPKGKEQNKRIRFGREKLRPHCSSLLAQLVMLAPKNGCSNWRENWWLGADAAGVSLATPKKISTNKIFLEMFVQKKTSLLLWSTCCDIVGCDAPCSLSERWSPLDLCLNDYLWLPWQSNSLLWKTFILIGKS